MAQIRGTRVYDKRRGKYITLLNPAEKGRKFAVELKNDKHITNEGLIKKTKNGKVKTLSDTAKAYRSGYLQARKDNAKCFNSKKRKNGQMIFYVQ